MKTVALLLLMTVSALAQVPEKTRPPFGFPGQLPPYPEIIIDMSPRQRQVAAEALEKFMREPSYEKHPEKYPWAPILYAKATAPISVSINMKDVIRLGFTLSRLDTPDSLALMEKIKGEWINSTIVVN